MTEYASLVVKVDATEAEKAKTQLDGMTDAGGKAEGRFESLANAATVVGTAIAAAATAAAAMVTASVNAADAAGEAAQSAGITTEEFTRLKYAMQFDVSPEALGQTFKFLNGAMYEAAAGTGKAADTFAALGIAVKNQDGTLRNSHDVLLELADSFQGMEDGARKTALAVDVFGRSGDDIIPFLNNGAAGIRTLEGEADALGVTLSGGTAAAAGHLSDQFLKMQSAVSGAGNSLMADLLPALTVVTEQMVEAAKSPGVIMAIGEAFVFVTKAVITAGDTVITFLNTIADTIDNVVLAFGALIHINTENKQHGENFKKIIEKTGSDVVETWSALLTRTDEVWSESSKVAIAAEKAKEDAAIRTGLAFAMQAKAAKEAAVAATDNSAPAAKTGTLDVSTGIVTEDFGAYLSRKQAEQQAELEQVRVFTEAKNKLYEGSSLFQADLDRLRAEDARRYAEEDAKVTAATVEAKAAQYAKNVDFFNKGLSAIAQGNSKASKAARALQTADAIYEIAVNTKRAVMGAYAFGSSIGGPILGAAMGAIAAGFGAAQLAGLGGGGGGSGVSSPSISAPSTVVQPAAAKASSVFDVTLVSRGGGFSVEQVREMMEMIGERMGDNGGRLGSVRVVTE